MWQCVGHDRPALRGDARFAESRRARRAGRSGAGRDADARGHFAHEHRGRRQRHIRASSDQVFALSIDHCAFHHVRATARSPRLIAWSSNRRSPRALRRVHQSDGVVLTERIDALDPPHHHAYTLSGFVPLLVADPEGKADWRLPNEAMAPMCSGATASPPRRAGSLR